MENSGLGDSGMGNSGLRDGGMGNNGLGDGGIRAIENLHSSAAVKKTLAKMGYTSSVRIFHEQENRFIGNVKGILDADEARTVYRRAETNYTLLTHMAAAVMTAAPLKKSDGDGADRFEDIPDYQEIFGNLDYCTCPKCKSVFGPAAYFVDLMRIIGKYIELETDESERTVGVPLCERRKDLWSLSLSCDNTNQESPYLKLVNQILENYHGGGGIYKELSGSCGPQTFPFHLPLEKVRTWLARQGAGTRELLGWWGARDNELALEEMRISPGLFGLLEKPLEDTGLRALLGVKEVDLGKWSGVSEFLKRMHMDDQELYALLEQDIRENEADRPKLIHRLFVNRGLEQGEYLRIEDGKLVNLTYCVLERAARFVRLARVLEVTYPQLEWMLETACPETGGEIPVLKLWEIWRFARTLKIDMVYACAFFADLKDYGDNPYLKVFGKSRQVMESYTEDERYRVLSRALHTDIGNLYILRDYLGQREPISPDVCFRHFSLAGIMGADMEEYTNLLSLVFDAGACLLFTPDMILELLHFWKKRRFDIETWLQIISLTEKGREDTPLDLNALHRQVVYIRSCLAGETQEDSVYTMLKDYFGTDTDTLKTLFGCVLEDEELKQWPEKLLKDRDFTEIDDIVKGMYGYLMLYKMGISAKILETVSQKGTCFHLENRGRLKRDHISAILRFADYGAMFEDEEGLLCCFALTYDAEPFSMECLSRAAGWDPAKAEELQERFSRKWKERPDILTFLDRMTGAMGLLSKLSLSPGQAEGVLEIIREAFTDYDGADRKACALIDPFMDETGLAALEAKKRDALLPVTLSALSSVFNDMTDYDKLYKYFLIDVEMDDKTRISPVKEGINALQLYLQRCRMRLEKGIREIRIPESWWSWMMDYSSWESNRRVFVYPENYLLPSVRHTKTGLFQDAQTAMEQSRITDGRIEEQYIQYLDAYQDLTQLKICGAYETVEEYYDVLYVFARTRQQPYTYYYCRRAGSLAWSQWEKIDANIDSDIINPVYVFGRLHIFWSTVQEKEKAKLRDGEQLAADNQRAYVLQVKYTYKNLQGRWIPPQTLVDGETVYVEQTKKGNQTYQESAERLGIYNWPERFRKLTLLRLTRKNVEQFRQEGDDYECLAVITGSFTRSMEENMELLSEPPELDREWETFTGRLNRLIRNNNFEVGNREDGYLNTGFFKIYNEDLEEEHFFHHMEFVVVDGYVPTKNSRMYNVNYDEVHHAIGVYLSQSVLRDGALPAEGILPFKNNGNREGRPVLTGKSFILLGDDGRQILSGQESQDVYDKLQLEGIIDEDGYADEMALASTDLMEFLGELLDDGGAGIQRNNLILQIQDVLLKNVGAVYLFERADRARVIPVVNQPGKFIYDCGDEAFLIYPVYERDGKAFPVNIRKTDEGTTVGIPVIPDTFVRMGIEQQTAIQIMAALKRALLADQDTGIVNMDRCTRESLEDALSDVSLGKKERDVELDRIYGRLLNLPMISKEEFETITGISGEAVCRTLGQTDVGILYPWDPEKGIYRIDLRRMKEKTDLILENSEAGPASGLSEAEVYKKLSSAVSSVRFHYRVNQDLPAEFAKAPFSQWKFGAERLTNPTIKKLKRKLEHGGIGAFLNRETQSAPWPPVMPFERLGPTDNMIPPKAADGAQIDFEGLYGEYNWELFYHIPMMIAQRFKDNSLYAQSLKWFHTIFNPTRKPDQSREKYYWNFVPFTRDRQETLEQMLKDPAAIQAYNDSPFDPHAIARLRADAYAKYTVMEYVSNLIQWGDSYFVQNTWESLTSAVMMYVWARDLLGPKPRQIRPATHRKDKSFEEIEAFYKEDPQGIPQFILDLELKLQEYGADEWITRGEDVPYNDIRSYFGVPENSRLLQMWDVVGDRLFKVRNSLDLNGAPRVTALFEPEKDPLSLVKRAAAGGGDVPGPFSGRAVRYPYRFSYMIAQAKMMAERLIQMGNAVEAAAAKQDGEALMALTGSQELAVLQMTVSIRELQAQEADREIEALNASREAARERMAYYGQHAKEYMSVREQLALTASDVSAVYHALSGTTSFASGMAHLLPQVGSPFAMKYGGMEIGSSLKGMADGYETLAGIYMHASQQSLTMAQYDRRKEEWELQEKQAEKDMEYLGRQIEAAKLRRKAAEAELEIQKKNFEYKKETLDFLKRKFTGAQLYQWLGGRLQSAMWQTYRLALEMGGGAQEAYTYERDEEGVFLRFDYWNEGYRGLTAGEHLMVALEQMEQAYQRKDFRRLEIEKHISMARTFPEAFSQLKKEGACGFEMGEKLFAADYPGCYCRKIAGIAISVPAVLPPYETVKATLKQLKSQILTRADTQGAGYLFHPHGEAPESVRDCSRYGETIAVSKGIGDSGMFVVNFQDERYLPFEGTGAASAWRLEMPKECNRFDLEQLTDIILTVRYTAKEDEKRGKGSFYDYVVQALRG